MSEVHHTNYYWSKLIRYWVKYKKRSGLTIPFLIGAGRLAASEGHFSIHSVAGLMTEIRNCGNDEVFTLQHCENVGEFVLGLNDQTSPKIGLIIQNEKTGEPKIIATLNTEVLGKTFDSIVDSLSRRYENCIGQGTYSRIDFTWEAFSDSDLEMINQALQHD